MAVWERGVADPHMIAPLNMAQIMLVTALELDMRNPEFVWRNDHPALLIWLARFADRPSVTSTRPDRPIVVA